MHVRLLFHADAGGRSSAARLFTAHATHLRPPACPAVAARPPARRGAGRAHVRTSGERARRRRAGLGVAGDGSEGDG